MKKTKSIYEDIQQKIRRKIKTSNDSKHWSATDRLLQLVINAEIKNIENYNCEL